jgi:predicted O-methyltransferase YrrM
VSPTPVGNRRCAITSQSSAPNAASLAYADGWLPEDAPLIQARARAHELGATPIGAGGGAALRFLAATLDARAVIEVGTGAGVSGLWLLTTIDAEAEHQRVARQTYVAGGFASNRTRLITGRALEVLPRLADGAYDLVFIDGDKTEYAPCLEQAFRLLRPGGIVAFDNILWHNRVADPSQRDASTTSLRDLANAVRDDERLVPALFPVGDGLLAAVVREPRSDAHVTAAN